MCDDFTDKGNDAALAASGISRRQFAAVSAATVLAATPGTQALAAGTLRESMVTIPTADGKADAYFVHPAKGKFPGVILWPDIAGLRDSKKAMAQRLAAAGYAVLVVNQYYRSAKSPVLASFAEWRTPEGQAKLRPMIQQITPETVTSDTKAFVTFLDAQKAVDKRRGIGAQGYCMGGPFAVRSAVAVPGRVKAAASFHGGSLVTDQPNSPHRLLASTQASFLFAIARNDDARAPTDKDTLRTAATEAKRPAVIEVFPADHGWCVPDSPSYDAFQAGRADRLLLELYAGL